MTTISGTRIRSATAGRLLITYLLVREVSAALGLIMIVMGLIAGFGGVRTGTYHTLSETERTANAGRLGSRIGRPFRCRW